jgi:hypothetical protein
MVQVTGTVIKLFSQETKGNFSFAKAWVKTNEQYPQTLEIECGGKKADLFNNLKVGNDVTIDINLNGREHNDRVYNKLSAWKVTVNSQGNSPIAHTPSNNFYNPTPDSDGMPF